MIRTLLNIDGAACATTTGKAKKRATEAVLQRGEDPKPYACAAIQSYDHFVAASAAATSASKTGQRR
ncbi:hypothetical protein [Streptomyces sp. NPDC020377]|uniref:hypothetical protein n=1 Tax=Streptomyces sp. NPDC020377 TaxID=3365070 RepID=UPI003799E6B2